MAAEADPALRRFELDAILACGVVSVAALVVAGLSRGPGAGLNAFLGVLAGGFLMFLSYRAIKGGVDVVARTAEAVRRPEDLGSEAADGSSSTGPVLSPSRRVFLAVKFFTRYALLAVAAYVMLTCFHLHPVGVLAGATSPFLAALVQVGRLSRAGPWRRRR